ncbi:MAG: dTMP kinase [Candidatus Aenigmarchaeota archaeon]|nr:dTMP kinase [Candidatus Aenigmarchaeota archaeon]
MKPLFIVIEGIDGCGKATQAALLASHVFRMAKDTNVSLTREPTGLSPASRRLREMLKKKDSHRKYAGKFLKLWVQDRKFHIRKIINPALKASCIVISERYYHSSYAYQAAQGLSFDFISQIHKGMPVPDLTIILDVEPEKAISRLSKIGNGRDSFERHDFLKKVRENYIHLPEKLINENIIIIPAGGAVEKVFEKVRDEFLKAWAAKETKEHAKG